MVNEVKLNGVINTQMPKRTEQKDNLNNKPTTHTDKAEGIKVSHHLAQLASSINTTEQDLSHANRLIELKQQIQNESYRVDIDLLASKLANGILSEK